LGFNTTVLILNDGFDQLRKNPDEFVVGLAQAMHDGGTIGVGNHCNPVQVMRTDHADTFRLYASQYNHMVELSPWSPETRELMERNPEYVRSKIETARWFLDQLEDKLPKEPCPADHGDQCCGSPAACRAALGLS
jgi:hypothetical protein